MSSISKMFLSRNGQATFLLLVLTQNLVFAIVFDKKKDTDAWTKAIINSMKVPWIHGMGLVINSSNSRCAKEIKALSKAIDAQKLWALEMVDASSKIQSGILQGNFLDLGTYDQCVAVDGNYNNVNVRGKHCMVTLDVKTLTLKSSICIPSSCDEMQALHIVSSVMKDFLSNISLKFEIEARTASCARIESEDFTFAEISTIAFFLAIGGFILICTIVDFVKRCWPEKKLYFAFDTLAKFSFYTNALAIFSTEVKPGMMLAINGIRFLSTCWIVVWHRYLATFGEPTVNSSDRWKWLSSWNSTWSQMATFATDNFLLISGFFMSYLFFKSMRSGNKFNLPMMYLHRYIRLTPCIAVVTLFITVLFHRIGNGPLWKIFSSYLVDDCRENWWVNFLYIQNILRPRNICLEYSWFLAVDMQLFWISPIILYPLHRWPKYGFVVWSVFLIASVVTPTMVIGFKGDIIIVPPSNERESFFNYYIQSYTRAFPYLIGILLGYEIATKKRRLSQTTVVTNWIVTCILLTLCFIAVHHLFRSDIKNYPIFVITCAAVLRPCWSIAMVWIIYACTQGYGGLLGRFFSLPIFLPLSRLSYGVYLVHLIIRFLRMGTAVTSSIFLDSEILNSYLGDLVMSIGVSGVISVFFEWPVMVLEKVLKNSPRKREQATPVRDVEFEVRRGMRN